MASTYTLISSVTVGSGGAATIEFTSIPNTYTDLSIYLSTRSTRASVNDTAFITFNGSSTGYSNRRLYGTGSAAASDNDTTAVTGHYDGDNATASTFGNGIIYIPNYTSSNYKSFSADGVAESNETGAFMSMVADLWSNTSAITSITFTPYSGNFKQYSTAYLYGISNA